jgi:ABC-type proline/glycine betaine transport system ATPase subunit
VRVGVTDESLDPSAASTTTGSSGGSATERPQRADASSSGRPREYRLQLGSETGCGTVVAPVESPPTYMPDALPVTISERSGLELPVAPAVAEAGGVAAAPVAVAAAAPAAQPAGPAPIASIHVKRFKGIQDLQLGLGDDALVLVGANNSGKSSVLHAAHFAVSVAQTSRLVGEGVSWANDTFRLSFNPTQLLWTPVTDVMALAKGGALAEDATQSIEITLADTNGDRAIVTVRRGRNRNIQVSIAGRSLGERLQDLENPFSVFTPGLAGIAREERLLSPGVVRRSVARGDANLVLRNVLWSLREDPAKWQIFCDDMQTVFPEIHFEVAFDYGTDEWITTRVRLGGGPLLPLDAAGTAVLQAAQILGYSALYNPPLVLLDEPDSHLHPNDQRSLCRLLTQLASRRRFRLMISTHSRHVLDALRGRSKVVWMAQGSTVSNSQASITERLLDLGALDTVDYFADAETKCVVITEDAEIEPIKALLLSCGFIESDTRIKSYDGCTKVDAATVLGQFIETNTANVEVVVHRDRDYLLDSAVQEFETQISNCDLVPFVTEFSDIEAHFVNAAHLCELNPKLTVEQAEQIIRDVVAETRTRSIETMVNIRNERAVRARARTGEAPNPGRIATEATAEFDADPQTRFRGKIVLGRVVDRIRALIHQNPRVFEPTTHLGASSPKLRTIAASIWRVELEG